MIEKKLLLKKQVKNSFKNEENIYYNENKIEENCYIDVINDWMWKKLIKFLNFWIIILINIKIVWLVIYGFVMQILELTGV